MGWKNFLIIPVLILLYIIIVDNLVSSNITSSTPADVGQTGGVQIGLGHAVEVSVTRPYLFGLIRLPIYSSALGDISAFHEMFFYFVIALTVVFIIIEKFPRKKHFKFKGGKIKMAKKVRFAFNWRKFLRASIVGLGVGILSFILSNDGGPSVALGLLLIYLEYKL